jgi:hypothetical protein
MSLCGRESPAVRCLESEAEFHRRQLKGTSEHFSRTSFMLAGTRREYQENKTGAGQYLSPGRRRYALARPSLASGIAESPGLNFWPPFRGRTRALPLSCTGLKRCKAGKPRLLPVSIEFQRKPRKFSIQGQKPIANGKSNISLPRLSGSDWRCAQILIA